MRSVIAVLPLETMAPIDLYQMSEKLFVETSVLFRAGLHYMIHHGAESPIGSTHQAFVDELTKQYHHVSQ